MSTSNYLLIDIGNSFTETAELSRSKTTNQWDHFKSFKRFPSTELGKQLSQYSQRFTPIISSVVPNLDHYVSAYFKAPRWITHQTVSPLLPIGLSQPAQVGADRLVNALAGSHLYGKPTLIIDSGTATTWCFVDQAGVYQGGNIFPGLGISSKSLHDYTEKLPLVRVKSNESLYGRDTKQAIQSGLYWGFIHLINGVIAQYRQQYPDIVCVGTGQGLVPLKNELKLDVWDAKLIFKGLGIFAQL